MTHARRARHALLTSLGLMPLACGLVSEADPGSGISDLEAAEQKEKHTSAPPMACGEGTPVLSMGGRAFLIEVGGPPQLTAVDTGLVVCETGVVHRPQPVTCQSGLPRPLPLAHGDAGTLPVTQFEFLYPNHTLTENSEYGSSECSADTDCDAAPFGFCAPKSLGYLPGSFSACYYGCEVDADCGAGFVCECGDPVGRCVQADCVSDAECGDGRLCAASYVRNACWEVAGHAFACQTAEDECVTRADCTHDRGACLVEDDGVRRCKAGPEWVCGRPFLVADRARLAPLVAGGDWSGHGSSVTAPAHPERRRRAAEHWARAALMEHASIAAFARFTLQLLHLGAPRELLEASQRAMLDETEHARLCFGLAESYLPAPVSPGALPMDGALLELDIERIVVLCFREGCVGETVAALEARVARDHARDAGVQCVLDRIAPDEEQHAELAWKFIRWALSELPTMTRAVLERERRQLQQELAEPLAPATSDAGSPEHGVLSERERWNIRRAAVREVVLPCAEALLGATGAAGSSEGRGVSSRALAV